MKLGDVVKYKFFNQSENYDSAATIIEVDAENDTVKLQYSLRNGMPWIMWVKIEDCELIQEK